MIMVSTSLQDRGVCFNDKRFGNIHITAVSVKCSTDIFELVCMGKVLSIMQNYDWFFFELDSLQKQRAIKSYLYLFSVKVKNIFNGAYLLI